MTDQQRAAALTALLSTAERYAERADQPPAADDTMPAWIAALIGIATIAVVILLGAPVHL